MEKRAHIFNAGPSVLPLEVLLQVQKDLVSYKGLGLSVMEMSHRSKDYEKIINEARANAKKIYGLGDDWEVLFLQGGASTQFLMVPMNFCPDDKVANYIDTGSWSTAAIKESKKLGKKTHVAASSADGFTFVPREFQLSENPAYLHITHNNTIRGTEYHWTPEVPAGVPLIADMSSNFMSRPVDIEKYDMVYAGAQKNVGPAGCVVVFIKKSYAAKLPGGLPTMLDYKTHIDKESMYNTPPAFAIYVIGEVFKWILEVGGIEKIHEMNIAKAKVIYDAIDGSNGFYKGSVTDKESRSLMNITFLLKSEELEKKFLSEASAAGMIGLKGHRSVGGCRASVYNACPYESAYALAEFMKEFAKNNQ